MSSPTTQPAGSPPGVTADIEPSEWRSIYVGGLPSDTKASEVLDLVTTGPVESMRFLPHKNCAFILFLNHTSAVHFFVDTEIKRPSLRDSILEFSWAKAPPLSPVIAEAVTHESACRNVYLGNLPDNMTDEKLRSLMAPYGAIETIKFRPDTHVAFVHYLAISSAMRAIDLLPKTKDWMKNVKLSFGKDRSLHISKSQKQLAALYLGVSKADLALPLSITQPSLSSTLAQMSTAAMIVAQFTGGHDNIGNRTIYLGNIHPDAKVDDICNATRGGLLQSVKYFPDKHFCFVTFADAVAAAQFYATWNMQRLHILNRFVRVSWGKHSGPLLPELTLAIANGATRNVYVGGIPSSLTEEQIRHDFAELGEIEQINFLRAKSCVFINFMDIENALNAITTIRQHPRYQNLKVRHGKDRCSKQPRIFDAPEKFRIREEGPVMLQFIARLQAQGNPGFVYPTYPMPPPDGFQDQSGVSFDVMTYPGAPSFYDMSYGQSAYMPYPYAYTPGYPGMPTYGYNFASQKDYTESSHGSSYGRDIADSSTDTVQELSGAFGKQRLSPERVQVDIESDDDTVGDDDSESEDSYKDSSDRDIPKQAYVDSAYENLKEDFEDRRVLV